MGLAEMERHTVLQPEHTAGAPLLLCESGCEMPQWRWPTQQVGPRELEELSWAAWSDEGEARQAGASSQIHTSLCVHS